MSLSLFSGSLVHTHNNALLSLSLSLNYWLSYLRKRKEQSANRQREKEEARLVDCWVSSNSQSFFSYSWRYFTDSIFLTLTIMFLWTNLISLMFIMCFFASGFWSVFLGNDFIVPASCFLFHSKSLPPFSLYLIYMERILFH